MTTDSKSLLSNADFFLRLFSSFKNSHTDSNETIYHILSISLLILRSLRNNELVKPEQAYTIDQMEND